MNIGESVAIGTVDSNEVSCPFDHDESKPPKVDNVLIGVGTTLRNRMKSGKSTHTFSARYSQDTDSIANPRDIQGHKLHQPGSKKPEVVTFPVTTGKRNSDGEEITLLLSYPVTCAAHHCIPAQESLKRSDLLDYMISKKEADSLKEGDHNIEQKGIVWSDIGYDVNGTENGIYLPGNYAAGGGRGGLKVWEEPDGDVDTDDEASFLDEQPVQDALSSDKMLTGELYDVSNQNRKWRYVKGAMGAAEGQFHDRHEDYSDFVLGVLQKIYTNLKILESKYITEEKCEKCKNRTQNAKTNGIPSPYGLVSRLNKVSKNMRTYLSGQGPWPMNVYTSDRVKVYLEKLLSASKKKAGRKK
jgi:hypothetical protein